MDLLQRQDTPNWRNPRKKIESLSFAEALLGRINLEGNLLGLRIGRQGLGHLILACADELSIESAFTCHDLSDTVTVLLLLPKFLL